MARLVGISGSLRAGSYNSALLRAAVEAVPAGSTLDIATIAGIPLYDADVEAQAFPSAATRLKDAIAGADGVLLVTPEYNNGIPGVFKNAIDWASRPSGDIKRIFAGRKFAVIGASPGRFGTLLSQDAWLPVLHTLGATVWSGERLMVSAAHTLFDAEGRLVDQATRDRLQKFLAGFAAFVDG